MAAEEVRYMLPWKCPYEFNTLRMFLQRKSQAVETREAEARCKAIAIQDARERQLEEFKSRVLAERWSSLHTLKSYFIKPLTNMTPMDVLSIFSTCSGHVFAVLVVREMLKSEGAKMRENAAEEAAEQKQRVCINSHVVSVMCQISFQKIKTNPSRSLPHKQKNTM